ncbi:MAG: hypothetical protein ACP5D9_09725 [Mariniphaga sp.]
MKDSIGRAIADYFEHGEVPDIKIQTDYFEERKKPFTEKNLPFTDNFFRFV